MEQEINQLIAKYETKLDEARASRGFWADVKNAFAAPAIQENNSTQNTIEQLKTWLLRFQAPPKFPADAPYTVSEICAAIEALRQEITAAAQENPPKNTDTDYCFLYKSTAANLSRYKRGLSRSWKRSSKPWKPADLTWSKNLSPHW